MSAGTLDFSSVGPFAFFPSERQITVASENDQNQPVATLGRESVYLNRVQLVSELFELAQRSPYVQPAAFVHLVNWLGSLPVDVPKPFVAVGDDGSISSEWDVTGTSLHVTFYNDADEVFFTASDGDEWEATTDAIDKVSSAVRVVTRLARG